MRFKNRLLKCLVLVVLEFVSSPIAATLSCGPNYEYLLLECDESNCSQGVHGREFSYGTRCGKYVQFNNAEVWQLSIGFYKLELEFGTKIESGIYRIENHLGYHALESEYRHNSSIRRQIGDLESVQDLPDKIDNTSFEELGELLKIEHILRELAKTHFEFSKISRIESESYDDVVWGWRKQFIYSWFLKNIYNILFIVGAIIVVVTTYGYYRLAVAKQLSKIRNFSYLGVQLLIAILSTYWYFMTQDSVLRILSFLSVCTIVMIILCTLLYLFVNSRKI